MTPPIRRNRVMTWVRTRISDGAFIPGEPAPSAMELSRITGYSAITCRKALKALQVEGVLMAGATPTARLRVAGPPSRQAFPDAVRALCDELVTRRRSAGLRQPDLAELIGHSVTSVGHAETGRLWHSHDWWEQVDKALDADGKLIQLHDAYRAAQVLSKSDNPASGPDVSPPAGPDLAVRSERETARTVNSGAGGQSTPDTLAGDLLTADEREAVRHAGQLYVLIAERIVGHGPTRDDDLAEIRAAIHVIQRAVESQAAARAYPKEFRLLGKEIIRLPTRPDKEIEQWMQNLTPPRLTLHPESVEFHDDLRKPQIS
jgi:DNA-binding transcriptional regulator YhcF (GntR family)